MSAERREQRLRDALAPIRGDYDLILIDCPPGVDLLAVNALVAADSVLIPMQREYYALRGLSALLRPSSRSAAPPTRSSSSRASCAPCTIPGTISPAKSVRS